MMYINAVLSYLGAWKKLQNEFNPLLKEIETCLGNVTSSQVEKRQDMLNSRDLDNHLAEQFQSMGWHRDHKLSTNFKYRQIMSIDLVKDMIGIEIIFGKQEFIESKLFTRFPYYVQTGDIQVGIILIPMMSLGESISPYISKFEKVEDYLEQIPIGFLKYPFAIVGYSEKTSEIKTTELSTELDDYLFDIMGLTLEQMTLQAEDTNYDFKQELPNNRTISKEICALANHQNGGVLLLGVDDDGNTVGISANDIDDIKQKISNIVNDTLRPKPDIEYQVFEIAGLSNMRVLVIRVQELPRKPCMFDDRVYVRSGSTIRTADTEKIRQLVMNLTDVKE